MQRCLTSLGDKRSFNISISANVLWKGGDIFRINFPCRITNSKPRPLIEHLGTGRHYNINSKRGKLHLLFAETAADNSLYNTDISAYIDNLDYIEGMHEQYVVIAPSIFQGKKMHRLGGSPAAPLHEHSFQKN